ncbi:3813_t:CDS:2 [Gigaspora rosea]|nr:3813_t:CDS:2 [Gigaspora rosea]
MDKITFQICEDLLEPFESVPKNVKDLKVLINALLTYCQLATHISYILEEAILQCFKECSKSEDMFHMPMDLLITNIFELLRESVRISLSIDRNKSDSGYTTKAARNIVQLLMSGNIKLNPHLLFLLGKNFERRKRNQGLPAALGPTNKAPPWDNNLATTQDPVKKDKPNEESMPRPLRQTKMGRPPCERLAKKTPGTSRTKLTVIPKSTKTLTGPNKTKSRM